MNVKVKIKGLIVFVFLAVLVSCTNKIEKKVIVDLKDNFPVLTISNPGGQPVLILPENKSTGSIGFIIDSTITWITGSPQKTEFSADSLIYTWNLTGGSQVNLKIGNGENDIKFSFSFVNPASKVVSAWLINIKASPTEYFTGIFERVVDGIQDSSWADNIKTALNLRAQKMDVKLKPTVSAYAPFYISSENYGFYVEGTWPGTVDFCKENAELVKIAFEGPVFTFKIYSAENPLDLVRRHALETGPSIVPPTWAFGPWRWRDEHSNNPVYYDDTQKKAPYNTDIVEDVLMMKALDIPATAHWIDRPWAGGDRGFDSYDFDTTRFPDPEGMIKWLNGENIELMMWIAPFVMTDMADYAEANKYDLKSKVWMNARQVLIDFTNPNAVQWWGDNGPGKLARMGIKGFKLDRADGEKETDSIHLETHIGTTYRENYNDYPHQFVKATYNAIKPVLGDNFVLFPRAQYTGSAKYGAMWAGDTDGKPEGLRSAIIGMQRCAIMGYPLWASDNGGYWGKFSRETTMRWIAFGCFSPIMEVGPTNNTGFWRNPDEPHYDIELIATWRLYSKIRMKLIDYLSEQAKTAHSDGTPVAMPLFLKYPKQEEAWNDWQTYMLGPDILVSAIWEKNVKEHRLYLPKGETWIDAWSKEEHEGGKYITVEAPLYKIPVFIRKGSKIDLGNLKDIYTESLKIASKKPDLTELEKQEGWK